MHTKPTHFVQHHADVTGGHEHFFLELFPVQHLNPHWLILDAPFRACGRDDGHLFLDRQLPHKLNSDHALLPCNHVYRNRDRYESLLHHGHLDVADWHADNHNPLLIGQLRCPTHDHLCTRDRVRAGMNLYSNTSRVFLAAGWAHETNSEQRHNRNIPHNRIPNDLQHELERRVVVVDGGAVRVGRPDADRPPFPRACRRQIVRGTPGAGVMSSTSLAASSISAW